MKNLTKICLCLSCLLSANTLHAQNDQNIDSQLIGDASEEVVWACKLQGPELMARKAALGEDVFARVKKIEEKTDGYLFHFEDKDDFLLTLVDYMLAEQKCCPFFQFDLNIKPNHEGIGLKVSGPPKAKEMIKMMVKP